MGPGMPGSTATTRRGKARQPGSAAAHMPYSYRYLRARRRWLVVLVLLVILLIHVAITARLFLSPEQVRFRIQTLLQEQSPGKASVGAAGYELPFGVRLGDIELYRAEEDGGELFFRAKALRVRGLPLALFRGKGAERAA